MKRISHFGQTIVTAAFAVLSLAACEYKDLEGIDSSRKKVDLNLHFDWRQVDSIPGFMRVVFYPEDKANYAQGYTFFDVLNRDTLLRLPWGVYNVSAWNNDMEHNITTGYSSQEKAYATTGSYSPHGNAYVPIVLDSIYERQRVLDYPDYMVHSFLKDFILEEDGEGQRLTLTPDSMVVTVEVRLHGICGLKWCHNIRGAINNLAGKRYIAYPNLTEDKVAIMFDGEAHEADSLVTAKFWIFGAEPSDLSRLRHKMLFFFWVTGNQVYVPIDITDIIANVRRDDTYILIEAYGLDIDLEQYVRQGSTGMVVDAEDWEETKEIVMSF